MTKNQKIRKDIFECISLLLVETKINIEDDTKLIGEDGLLDSMKLVELCLALEDMASDLGFEFDWTSDATMSRNRSMFRTAGAILEEFENQMSNKK